jgi:putative hydrolase of the HAD superfamily
MLVTGSSRRHVYVFDLGGVCCTFDHERRLDALASASGLPRDEVSRRLWDSGFVEECNRGRFTAPEAYAWAVRALGMRISYQNFGRLWSSAFTPQPTVLHLVDHLRATNRTVMLTDNGPILRDGMVTHLPEISDRFDQLLFSCDLGAVKPELKLFMAVTRRLGVAPSEISLIDDVPEFAAAAEAFGWRALVFAGYEQLVLRLAA